MAANRCAAQAPRGGAASRAARAVAAAAAGVLVLAGCGVESVDGTVVEYRATELRTGEAVSLAEFRGSAVLLSGWATWCPPCREELPELNELYEQRRADGLVVIAVNLDAAGPSVREVTPLVDQLELTMPNWIDTDNDFAVAFAAVSMPSNVLIDRNGVVRYTWRGAIDVRDPEVVALIDEVLADG